ncbi:unnamed protein product [Arctogadus glacialis]
MFRKSMDLFVCLCVCVCVCVAGGCGSGSAIMPFVFCYYGSKCLINVSPFPAWPLAGEGWGKTYLGGPIFLLMFGPDPSLPPSLPPSISNVYQNFFLAFPQKSPWVWGLID